MNDTGGDISGLIRQEQGSPAEEQSDAVVGGGAGQAVAAASASTPAAVPADAQG